MEAIIIEKIALDSKRAYLDPYAIKDAISDGEYLGRLADALGIDADNADFIGALEAIAADYKAGAIYDGKAYKLEQSPYLDGGYLAPCYRAAATDAEGGLYLVTWRVTCDDFADLDDESGACDWNKFIVEKV